MTANQLRLRALEAIHRCGKGHPGGVLSCMDIVHALYYGGMALRPKEPLWADRDRFLMSKGHCVVAQYVALADLGYFPQSEMERLNNGGILGEHAHIGIPGIDANTGSLGHGLGIACGIALAGKLRGANFRTFVLLGDAELWEGSVWEAAMFAAHHCLNITVIVDRNGLAIMDKTENIVALDPLLRKWEAFGWCVAECNGHDAGRLKYQLELPNGPNCIIADTIKGKGVTFMENEPHWHHGHITDEQMSEIRRQLT